MFTRTATSRWLLVGIVFLGAWLRFEAARQSPSYYIERVEFIPIALTISPDHLPLRVSQHGALPAYLIRASGMIFGETLLGFRMLSVIAGTATIVLLFLIAARWWGTWPGLIAAAILAIERYHIAISGVAFDLAFDLFFIALTLYCFSRFLHAPREPAGQRYQGAWLVAAGVACGFAFLCKELSAMLVPGYGLALLAAGEARWFKRPATWIAAAAFVVVIAPDLYASATTTEAERRDLRDRHLAAARQFGTVVDHASYTEHGLYMSYGDHWSRFRGLGFNATPLYFYVGDILERLGIEQYNGFGEFPFMNPWLGSLLLIGVLAALVHRGKDPLTIALLVLFALVFVVLSSVQIGAARTNLPSDPSMLFYWVDRTLFPAILLASFAIWSTGARLIGRRGVIPGER